MNRIEKKVNGAKPQDSPKYNCEDIIVERELRDLPDKMLMSQVKKLNPIFHEAFQTDSILNQRSIGSYDQIQSAVNQS